jgi:hypothetical protein
MTGSVQDANLRVSEIDLLAILQRLEGPPCRRRGVQAIGGAGAVGKGRATRTVVGMHVRIDDMRDPHALRGSKGEVFVEIAFLRIDDRAPAERPATEEVRGAARIEVVVGAEDHGRLRSDSSGWRRLTLHGQTGRPPIRETFAEPLRAAAVRLEDLDRTIRIDAVGTPAVGDVRLLPGKFLESLLEIVDRHRERAGDVTSGVLPRRPGIEDDDVVGAPTPQELLHRYRLGL